MRRFSVVILWCENLAPSHELLGDGTVWLQPKVLAAFSVFQPGKKEPLSMIRERLLFPGVNFTPPRPAKCATLTQEVFISFFMNGFLHVSETASPEQQCATQTPRYEPQNL